MKISIISSSPRKEGTTSLLVDEFIRGAEEARHEVFRFNAAFEKIAPCTACGTCKNGKEKCIHNDSMEKLYPHLLEADCVVFVTPLYYFGMTAQLKTVIDRFYAVTGTLKNGSSKKAVLMVAAWEPSDTVSMKGLAQQYKTLVEYFGWEDIGVILAGGCGTREAVAKSDFPKQAYQLGKSL